MLRILFLSLLITAAIATTAIAGPHSSNGGGADKVTVEHDGRTLTIARAALPAHLAHGDTLKGRDKPRNK